jgi:hypothetical protein
MVFLKLTKRIGKENGNVDKSIIHGLIDCPALLLILIEVQFIAFYKKGSRELKTP